MKIAFLSFYSGEVNRGNETFVHELAQRLTKLGNNVTVFQKGPSIKNSLYLTQQIVIEKSNEFSWKSINQLDKATDILFCTNGRLQSLVGKLWTIRHHSKLVISGQSGPGFDDRLNLYVFPDVFIALSSFHAKIAKKRNPFIKIKVIPNGVDIARFSGETNKIKLDLPSPIILAVGALEINKRLDLAIKAVSKTAKGSLVIIGKGSQEVTLSTLGNSLLPNRFKILALPNEEMPQIYKSADIFTFPTVPWESFGIVLVEAMACGLPVVATDDLIRREIVGKAGLFVDPVNTEAYAAALQEALNRKWDNEPRTQAEKFSWDKIAKEYDQLFKSLVNQ